mmetsp:Transcript_25033/g.59501  ORF Transcript_25033/g.59501 Transcript_25033/m.59501 type:complete len:83 (-) Transcript_25033:103-351(-)
MVGLSESIYLILNGNFSSFFFEREETMKLGPFLFWMEIASPQFVLQRVFSSDVGTNELPTAFFFGQASPPPCQHQPINFLSL